MIPLSKSLGIMFFFGFCFFGFGFFGLGFLVVCFFGFGFPRVSEKFLFWFFWFVGCFGLSLRLPPAAPEKHSGSAHRTRLAGRCVWEDPT